jgi:hypothetical protein
MQGGAPWLRRRNQKTSPDFFQLMHLVGKQLLKPARPKPARRQNSRAHSNEIFPISKKGIPTMSRMKSIFAAVLVVAVAVLAPQANAVDKATIKIMIAGSSAMWQSMALATYNKGTCFVGSAATPPCHHYTSGSNFNLFDTRPTKFTGGTTLNDANAIWIVWDSHTTSGAHTPNVWAYIKVDSVVGQRCYFAQPHCNTQVTTFPAPGNSIKQNLWGDGSVDCDPDPVRNPGGCSDNGDAPTVEAAFTAAAGVLVTAAATDIRPEDGLFAMCRTNSALGAGDVPAGLGYNSNNAAGACPTTLDLAHLVGTPIGSAAPNKTNTAISSNVANVAAFNISGHDPFNTTLAIPAPSSVSVGAAPIVFIATLGASTGLTNVTNITDAQAQAAFSGDNCNANNLTGGAASAMDIWLREPLSGTMNTTEATVFRYPDNSGKSQEKNVTVVGSPAVLNAACAAASGTRLRGIGTGDIANALFFEGVGGGTLARNNDSLGYMFFSYGNVTNGSDSLVDSGTYRYLTLDGVDPIFHTYVSTASQTTHDPGQPNASVGEIPGANDLKTLTGCDATFGFPCPETSIWKSSSVTFTNGLSFPNVRSGQYRSWSVLRLVSNGAALAVAKSIAKGAQTYVVSSTPDYIPALSVGTTTQPLDPGLRLLRSHYTQEGVSPINETNAATGDTGGDMGGCILSAYPGAATSGTITLAQAEQADQTTKLGQTAPLSACSVLP